MEEKVNLYASGKIGLTEERNIANELADLISSPPEDLTDESIIANIAILINYIARRRTAITGLKKSGNNINLFNTSVEPISHQLTTKISRPHTLSIILDAYLSSLLDLASEPNERYYSSCVLAMELIRSNSCHFKNAAVLSKTTKFILQGIGDCWSDIRKSFVIFAEHLIQESCSTELTEIIIRGLLQICSQPESTWQSIQGSLDTLCCVVDSLSSKDSEALVLVKQLLLPTVWSYISHQQAGVRDSAIRAITAHLVRSDENKIDSCLDKIFRQLSETNKLSDEAVEGYFAASIEFLKLLSNNAITRDWMLIVMRYIGHRAATVRCIVANLVKTLVGKHSSSAKFFQQTLASLANSIEEFDVNRWEEVEGRLMAAEGVLRYAIANHWLYNFTQHSQVADDRFSSSMPVSRNGLRNDALVESNFDIAAEIVSLSKSQKRAALKRGSFHESKLASVSFECMDNCRPVSLLDVCIINSSEVEDCHASLPPLSSIFKTLLIAASRSMDSNQWELRRISCQVLPYVGEAIRWYNVDLFWKLTESLLVGLEREALIPGRAPEQMCATSLMTAWLQQCDRICVQIEDGRLVASTRLKDYIYGTRSMAFHLTTLMTFCNANTLDRQSVTSCRTVLQFLARTNLSDLASLLPKTDIGNLMHDALIAGVSLVWTAVDQGAIIAEGIELAKLFVKNLLTDAPKIVPKRSYLLFGSAHQHASSPNLSNSINGAHAKAAIIEQILPEIVSLLRHFEQGASSTCDIDAHKVQTSDQPSRNAFLMTGSLLPPLAYMLALYSYDAELLSYITEAILVIMTGLFSCESQNLFESVTLCIESFIEQLHENISSALLTDKKRCTTKQEHGFSVYASTRVAFWGCRLVLKHSHDPLVSESIPVVLKLAKLVAIISRDILGFISFSEKAPKTDFEDGEFVKKSWGVIGTGEILRPTPLPDNEEQMLPDGQGCYQQPTSEKFSEFDSDETSDDNASDGTDAMEYDMTIDEDLNDLFIELVTEIQTAVNPIVRDEAISMFEDAKQKELLTFLFS